MKIKSIRFFRKTLQLKNKIFIDGSFISEREIFLIKIETDENYCGLGESVILKSHGTESKEIFLTEFENFSKEIFNTKLEDDFFANTDFFNLFDKTPALRNAIEQSIFNITFKKNSNNLPVPFNKLYNDKVKLNALVPDLELSSQLELIQKGINSGFNCFKIKVGNNSIKNDLNKIRKIRKSFPDIKLRLDPNAKWNFDDLKSNADQFNSSAIEYIEEPVKKASDLISLQKDFPVEIAADESANNLDSSIELIKNNFNTIILKPITFGGIINSFRLMKFAETTETKIIISSSFESNIGFQVPSLLAATLKNDNYHGLNTSEYFLNNFANYHWSVNNGCMDVLNLYEPFTSIND